MKQILVIDDDEYIRRSMRRMLEKEGFEVLDAEDGNDGLELYHKYLPDLIITDIIMPDKEGIETIFALRKENPEVKIIAMSGGGKRLDIDQCLLAAKVAGVQKTIAKPFERNELLMYVKDTLSK